MICEILRPVFDALDDGLGFHGLGCGENLGVVSKEKWEICNAQNLRRSKQRKGMNALIGDLTVRNKPIPENYISTTKKY